VLRSYYCGLTWARKRVVLFDRDNPDPRNGAPLLDVLFTDVDHGFAVGAYATLLRTDDGGESWNYVDILNRGTAAAPTEEELAQDAVAPSLDDESWNFNAADLDLDEETDPHLNGIARTGNGNLFIVAERGAAFRSTDGGSSWQRIQLPYEGSMFGVIGGSGDHVLCFGLRGNVYESNDLGSTWTKRETGTELSLMGGDGCRWLDRAGRRQRHRARAAATAMLSWPPRIRPVSCCRRCWSSDPANTRSSAKPASASINPEP
jgi:photosystem II stability/assembly factor-like uncharacterized protein